MNMFSVNEDTKRTYSQLSKEPLIDLLEEYTELYDEAEETLQTFELLSADIGYAMDEICDQMEYMKNRLNQCRKKLQRL